MAHSADPVRESVLFVHAHPDDEVISTGGTLALMARNGTDVTVLTCTRGEQGEVIPPALQHLEGDGPALAEYRSQVELPAALRALGVERHLFLGAAGARRTGLPMRHYADSGMVEEGGRPRLGADVATDALCSAPFDEVVADIVAAIAATEAEAVVSYDEFGGYGHPDHLLAHRASRVAATIARVPFHVIVEEPRELARLEAAGEQAPGLTLLDVTPVLDAKLAALRAHATQVQVAEVPDGRASFALSNNRWRDVPRREAFRLLDDPAVDAAGAADGDADAPDVDDPAPATRSSRVASALVSLIVGLLVGVLLTINHQQHITLGTVMLPVGVVAGLTIFTAIVVGMRLVFTTRLYALLTAIGVVLASALLSQEGPGGSVLVPANLEGFVWAYAPLVIGAVVLAWPRLPQSRRDRMEAQSSQEGSPL